MSLWRHLLDLRRTLVVSAAGVALGAVAGWIFYDQIIGILRIPVENISSLQHRLATLNFSTVSGAFELRLQISVTVGIILSSPVWMYEVFRFFSPAMTRKEKKYAIGFLASAVPLFILGAASGWYVLPRIVEVVTSFASSKDSAIMDALTYYGFVVKLMLILGVAFVLPAMLVVLNLMGVISARSILKSWRWAVLLIVLFTAAATPAADVLSMFALALPMAGLYFLAWFISFVGDRRRARFDSAKE